MSSFVKRSGKALETFSTFALVALTLGLWTHRQPWFEASLICLAIGLFWKSLAVRISDAWLRFSEALGLMNGRIVLTIVFFLFLVPISFFYRLFAGDILRLKSRIDPKASGWVESNRVYLPKDLEQVW